jgi:hypothetical protein
VILPTHDPTSDDVPVFPILNLDKVGPTNLPPDHDDITQTQYKAHIRNVTRRIFVALSTTLERLLDEHPGREVKRVALRFDESQKLVKEEYGYKAFHFHCIQRWLMEIPSENNF